MRQGCKDPFPSSGRVDDLAVGIQDQFLIQTAHPAHTTDLPYGSELIALHRASRLHDYFLEAVFKAMRTVLRARNAVSPLAGDSSRDQCY